MRIAREPDILERALVPLADLEAIHGDIHGPVSLLMAARFARGEADRESRLDDRAGIALRTWEADVFPVEGFATITATLTSSL
jgi:hypothetical protein